MHINTHITQKDKKKQAAASPKEQKNHLPEPRVLCEFKLAMSSKF